MANNRYKLFQVNFDVNSLIYGIGANFSIVLVS